MKSSEERMQMCQCDKLTIVHTKPRTNSPFYWIPLITLFGKFRIKFIPSLVQDETGKCQN